MNTMKFDQHTAEVYAEKMMSKKLDVILEPELCEIAEQQARASHEGWLKGKAEQGYIFGIETNDDPTKGPLTNPLMVPYDQLPCEAKQSNIQNAVSVLQILKSKGCEFVNFTEYILYPIAKGIHDEWCREKLRNGWVWGPITDKSKKVHRDLIPFEVLASDPELKKDIKYDVDTARSVITQMLVDNDVYTLIGNLAQLNLAVATTAAD